MRTEQQVMKQLLAFAESQPDVRAVVLNGSRVNDKAPRDILQDYDVAFFVERFSDQVYKVNPEWIGQFGELVIMQQNDLVQCYLFLMQFKDGVRIDLSFKSIDYLEKSLQEDSLSKVILDKDSRIVVHRKPNERSYYPPKPTREQYDALLNEAWWIQAYVAKGIWRDELPYAKYMFDVILMDCLRQLLTWHLGVTHQWQVNVGKCGKWFKTLLPAELYDEYVATYPTTDYDELWAALSRAGRLIHKLGIQVGDALGYTYPLREDINVTNFVQQIKDLPRDAESF